MSRWEDSKTNNGIYDNIPTSNQRQSSLTDTVWALKHNSTRCEVSDLDCFSPAPYEYADKLGKWHRKHHYYALLQ